MERTESVRLRKARVDDEFPDNYDPVLRRVLLARGIAGEDGLNLRLDQLARPSSLSGLSAAANIVCDAIVESRHIRIVGDFDADGATGTAVAMRGLRMLGASNVDFRVPNRFEYGYGLTPGLVESFANDLPDLVVTVDSGIACLAGTARARELGCSVVITDHHLPGPTLPEANAIVNPNLNGDAFPSKALAGVGVMFYLLSAVRRELDQRDWFDQSRKAPRLDSLLDLVALGTVADLVPLDYNNRILVNQGLARIRAGRACAGIMALLRVGKRDYRHLGSSDLGFAVGPRLNAAGRLQDMGIGIQCLLADSQSEAMEIASQLDALNSERKALQKSMQQQAMDMAPQIEAAAEGAGEAFSLCMFDRDWHQGVVGLVASKVKDKLHKPVVAFAPEDAGSERLKGSARSIPGLHIRDVLAHVDANEPGLIDAFGGHAMAAGLSLHQEALDSFIAAFEKSTRIFLDDELPSAIIEVDGELDPKYIDLPFAQTLRGLGPWGQQFPEPVFEGAFEVLDRRVVGGAHLKMIVRPIDGHHPVDAIAFGRLPEDLPAGNAVRLLYRLDVNHFRGKQTCQLMVERILK